MAGAFSKLKKVSFSPHMLCLEEPRRFKVLQCRLLLFQEELVVLALLKVQ